MSFFESFFCAGKQAIINAHVSKINQLEIQLSDKERALKDAITNLNLETEHTIILNKQLENFQRTIDQLNLLVPEPIESWEKEWEEKFKQTSVKWNCRPRIRVKNGQWIVEKIAAVDVMAFWLPKTVSGTATMIRAMNMPAFKAKDWDTLAWKCEEHVKKRINYVSELPHEYWKFPWETEMDGAGDCDDGAIYLANLMLAVGIPAGRIKGCVGDVEGGGHYYVSYCRTTDNKHVILDWCFQKTTKLIKDRPKHSDNYSYYGVKFSLTPKATWARPDFEGV